VRIYALAKDLDIDSKELVEVCRKAGISGKGSALASLSDDEVAKVKAFLRGGDKKSEAGQTPAGTAARRGAPEVYRREDYIAPVTPGKVKVLDVTARRPASKGEVGKPVEEAPPQEIAPPQEAPAAPVAAPAPVPAAEPGVVPAAAPGVAPDTAPGVAALAQPAIVPVVEPVLTPAAELPPQEEQPAAAIAAQAPAEEEEATAAESRAEPSREGRWAERRDPKIIHLRGDDKKEPSGAPKLPRKSRQPIIKLAEMPAAKKPPAAPKAPEVKAQKPEIRLTPSAIAGHRAGQKAPLEQLTKEHFAKTQEKKGKPAPPDKDRKKGGKPEAEVVVEAPLSGKGVKRRRADGTEEEVDGKMAGMAAARLDRQKSRKVRARARTETPEGEEEREAAPVRRPKTLVRRHGASTAAPRRENVVLELPCTVRSFSEATGVGSGQVLKSLMGMGIATLNINAQLDNEIAQLLATDLGIQVEFRRPPTLEELVIQQLEAEEEDPELLQPRPPVVTFLGHVDHGKTSLLDYIIGTNVVAGEAGGITQHIRAYRITKNDRAIAFVDTPGHEAFTEMRARGANVTDIVVLVVAADDGVMRQTEEAISHAKAAEVPIIVALNKMDVPGANPERVLQQLTAQNLLPSEWGGDMEVIRTSAVTGAGMDDLLETILLTADLNDYRANPDRSAVGVCLEAEQQAGRGVIAKLIVRRGTLRVGDVVVCGSAYGRVKAMYDTLDVRRRVDEAGPSTPVNLTGFDSPPNAGDRFYVLDDISQARQIAEQRAVHSREQTLAGSTTRVSFEEFQRRLAGGNLADASEVTTLNLVIRADVRGSIEAIEKELSKLHHPEVQIKILHKAVGAITAADVMLAHASQAVVIGFNVIPDEAARSLADEKQVEIRRYDIIYKMTDDVKATLEGKLKPEQRVVELGHAVVKRVFSISRVGAVAGCYVVRGSIARGCRIRVNRDGRTIGDYELDSLRHEKDDVKEVPRGMECGIKLAGFNDIKQDDVLEAYKIEEVARTL
jgi:translation initiation factor IF-2